VGKKERGVVRINVKSTTMEIREKREQFLVGSPYLEIWCSKHPPGGEEFNYRAN